MVSPAIFVIRGFGLCLFAAVAATAAAACCCTRASVGLMVELSPADPASGARDAPPEGFEG